MISIIIPLYNKSAYIEKCISSVLKQTYSNFELIIINDGSTDDSISKLEQYTDPRIKIHHQLNAGVSNARNNGVAFSSYEYIAFLDADDWWAPDFLVELVNLIADYPEAVLWGCNYYYVKNGVARIEPKGLPIDFRSGYIDYVSVYGTVFCALINCSYVVVRKSAFWQADGFHSQLKLGEDVDLWLRLSCLGKVGYINKPLAYSNQDVDIVNRAIGRYKLYKPDEHFVFNLFYLKSLEQSSVDMKRLLDGLRVRALIPYYLSGSYFAAVHAVLQEVDFSQQSAYYKWVYHSPLNLVRLVFSFRSLGSNLKQYLLRSQR